MRILLLAISIFMIAANGLCQEQTAIPTAPPTALPTPRSPYLQFLMIQADVAEHTYTTEPTTLNLGAYVNTMQEMVNGFCLESLRNGLDYKGYPQDERCRRLLKKILNLDANNPTALCAQYGIDSAECRQGWADVGYGSYNVDTGYWESFDGRKRGRIANVTLNTAINDKTLNKKFADLDRNLYSASVRARANPRDPGVRSEYEKLLEPALQAACREPKLSLEKPSVPPTPTAPPNKANMDIGGPGRAPKSGNFSSESDQDDPFADVLKSIGKGAKAGLPTPTPLAFEGPNYEHVRVLPEKCASLLKNAQEVIPNSPIVICYREGFSSPGCVDARRRRPGPAGSKTAASPLENF